MSIPVIAALVFASLAAAVALGMALSHRLDDHHLGADARDTVKLTLGLMGTLAALLLGLLVSSANESFDTERTQINALAAKIATLDRVLAVYGAETDGARRDLRTLIEGAVAQAWPTTDEARSSLDFDEQRGMAVFRSLQQLEARDAAQMALKVRATDLAFELIEGRSLLVALSAGSVPVPVLVLVIAWLVVILFGFSLLAPRKPVAVAALFISAVAVSGAVVLMLELYRPFEGVLRISSEPLLMALGPP